MSDDTSGATLGVEEEFLLVDAAQGTTVPAAAAVLAHAAGAELSGGAVVARELRDSQVEVATGVCTTAEQLAEQLRAGRAALAEAARAAGVLAVPVATPPLASTPPADPGYAATDPTNRYGRIDQLYAGLTRDYEACGLHVHVGVADRDLAVAVVNHVNRWLPVLLALSVNSPFHHGVDTGYGSWRIVQQSRFPGSGLAPHTRDYAAFRAEIARLVECGVLADDNQTFWFARPSPRLPTVEVRIADTAAELPDAVLQGLVARALVRTALTELDRGREADPLPGQLAAAAVWSAARYGLSGPGVDPDRGVAVPATALVRDLFEHIRDALTDTGDLTEVRRLLARTGSARTGADRQRCHANRAGLAAVPAAMALRVDPSSPGRPGDPLPTDRKHTRR